MSMPSENVSTGGGNVFTNKLGPLPLWGWMAIAMLLAVFYYLYKKNQSNASSTGANSAASNTPGGVDSSLVPQFVNQTYVTNNPPPAPDMNGNSNPAYGQAGPPNKDYQAITVQEAKTLQSNNNLYNTSGRKAQRPFIWNGSAYVPNTNPINGKYQYYAGPTETQEINAYVNKKPGKLKTGGKSSAGAPGDQRLPASKTK